MYLFLVYILHLLNFIRGGKVSLNLAFIPLFSTENKSFNK